jgi:hypothetical protein
MADKFGFGKVSMLVKGIGQWPGQQYSVLGVRKVVPGLNTNTTYDTEYQYGFGEIVKVLEYKDGAYHFRPMITGDSAASCAVIMRDIVGGQSVAAGPIPYGKSNVPVSLFLLSADQYGSICVPCASITSIAVGGTPYIGLGTGTTTAGSVYGAAQGDAGVDSIALTGWEFKELPHKPSDTTAYAAIIGKKLDI